MDPDVIGIVIALFAFTATVLGGVSRMLARQTRGLDIRFDRIDERFTKVETGLTDLRTELKGDIAEVRAEMADLKTELKADIADVRVSIARLEGPLPKLQRI